LVLYFLRLFINKFKYDIVFCFANCKITTSILQKVFYLRLKKLRTLKLDLERQGGLFLLPYWWFDKFVKIFHFSFSIYSDRINFNLQTQKQ
jgi:hypothetical protein